MLIKRTRIVAGVLLAGAVTLTSMAGQPVQAAFFDMLGDQGDDVDGLATGPTTVDGITATVSATPNGVLNTSGSNFGINSTGTNETTRIDKDSIFEVLTISFDQDVYFKSFSITSTSGATIASYDVGGTTGTFDFPSGTNTETIIFPGLGVLISSPTLSTFGLDASTGATGYSFDSFTVNAIPEPASLALLAMGAGMIATRQRRA